MAESPPLANLFWICCFNLFIIWVALGVWAYSVLRTRKLDRTTHLIWLALILFFPIGGGLSVWFIGRKSNQDNDSNDYYL